MRLYSENGDCPKCGSWSASVKYNGSALERGCSRCGYTWHEMPLDTAKKQREIRIIEAAMESMRKAGIT